MADRDTGRRPWHLWAVGTAALLLAGSGAYDQIMTLTLDEHYFRQQGYGSAQRDYFSDYPAIPAVLWIVAVWSTLAAAVLLLLRRRRARDAAVVGLISQTCLALTTFAVMDRWSVFGASFALVDIVILALTAGFTAYCWSMSARGVLH
ncbi:MAG: hypothetical protein SW019_23360 [Actinomycetota bacterium]|nr:hypothetical protein [Actinomycetota bacterium]